MELYGGFALRFLLFSPPTNKKKTNSYSLSLPQHPALFRPQHPPPERRYYEKLKPDCIEEQVSFEERAQMRQEEIDSLNEVAAISHTADHDFHEN